jgi:hypothetical protein
MYGQMRSNVAVWNALTNADASYQVAYSNVRAVRDEEAAGSNPATPTQVTGHSPTQAVAYFYAVQQQSTATPTSQAASRAA